MEEEERAEASPEAGRKPFLSQVALNVSRADDAWAAGQFGSFVSAPAPFTSLAHVIRLSAAFVVATAMFAANGAAVIEHTFAVLRARASYHQDCDEERSRRRHFFKN
eukprot:CAMPEP_0119309980 /NCGR_PEP_ID=MMETSP1333-20130426/17632_1 /TAXON_ID=418940 /ORGANISM="Scyphosphaera apsteinii, Strain RCC1455" /LENGTH=106 /DNA_ID=CAMNT_0007314083 /DNA_START=923 /DNA_END=1241 /DNA_ORIENTATION=-